MIDLVDNLPHFFLLLLILQRFDDAKWGCFTGCPQSGVVTEVKDGVLVASFVAGGGDGQGTKTIFYPEDHEIYFPTTLIGRGTSVIGGRKDPGPDSIQPPNTGIIQDRQPLNTRTLRDRGFCDTTTLRSENDIVVKIYWPEEARTSEVDILRKVEEHGRKIDFIKRHTPEMICHLDPLFLCSSTKTIRQFLGLPTGECRSLRIIASKRLWPIRGLGEKDMLTAYLGCFFSKYEE